MIDELINSEYNNAGELMGLDAAVRAIRALPPAQQVKALRKLAQPSQVNASRRSRQEFEKHIPQLPVHIREGLHKGTIRMSDATIYSIKPVNSKTIKMFEPQDTKEVGVRNISNAKLPKNTVLVVSGIYLLAGVNMAPENPEAFKTINFSSVGKVAAISNGEFSLKSNKIQIIPENQSIRRFITDNDMTVPLGYYKLDNPRLIRDEELIEFTVELGTELSVAPNTWLYVGLDGTMTTP